jgi:hypothetical protein
MSTYGINRKTTDENICRSKIVHEEIFSGRGIIDDAPATPIYLRRTDGTQAFYVPEFTAISCHARGIISNVTDPYSTSTIEHVTVDFLVFRDTGGNVTVVIDPATPQTEVIATITPTANTAVQGFELVLSAVGTPDVTLVFAAFTVEMSIVNETTYQNRVPLAGTAARTTAE